MLLAITNFTFLAAAYSPLLLFVKERLQVYAVLKLLSEVLVRLVILYSVLAAASETKPSDYSM